MRKKIAVHLDARYATMIENAFFYSNPPESRAELKSQLPPMHEYIRKLLYKDLSKTTVEKVLRQMRKLDWDDSEVRCCHICPILILENDENSVTVSSCLSVVLRHRLFKLPINGVEAQAL